MVGQEDFKWDGYRLYLGDEYVGRVYEADILYRILWADGVKSDDYYNISRAKDNLIKHTIDNRNAEDTLYVAHPCV